jgi:soluble lytic murein transglycosylase
MIGWAAALQLAVSLAAGEVAWADSNKAENLLSQLSEKEHQIRVLRERIHELESLESGSFYREAQALGIVDAVRDSGLPEHSQRRVAAAIVRHARRNRLDPLLIVAVIRTESSFDNYAKSWVGAMGLMQITPQTGQWVATKARSRLGKATNLYDAELNIELGTAYLASLVSRFGTLELALAAYNVGPAALKKILADRSARRRFLAGYPARVVRQLNKLRQMAVARVATR